MSRRGLRHHWFTAPSTLRAHLIKLIIAALAPLLLFAIALIVLVARQQQESFTRGLQETTRALSGSLQLEFESTITTLHALGSSEAVDNGAMAEFRRISARMLASHDSWAVIALYDTIGREVFAISRLPSVAAKPSVDHGTLKQVLRESRPLAGSFSGDTAGTMTIYVPVQRENKLIYVLSAAIERRAFSDILVRQKLPGQWTGVIFDRGKIIVARTRDPERFVGKPVGPVLRNADATAEGIVRGDTVEGISSYAAISTLPRSGWSVALIVPAAQVTGPFWRSLAYIIGLGLISLLLGIGLAALFARRIGEPIQTLSESAKALGAGQLNSAPPPSTILELNEVAQDMAGAAELLRVHSRERDRVEAELRERDAFLEQQAELLRQSEEKLRRQAVELEHQLLASGRLVAVGELTASMAHEFNNPLGIILGFAQGLLAEMDPADPRYHPLEIIAEETQRCERLVKELLEFGRPRQPEFTPVELKSVIERTLALVSNRASKNKVETMIEVTEVLAPIHADAQQLQQLLLNLALNAIDAMPRGGTLTLSAAKEDAARVKISVADSGVGIDSEMQKKIFQPFVTGKKGRGLGLGLPICDRIVKAHGGTMEVTSVVGRGTTFTIYLPAKEKLIMDN